MEQTIAGLTTDAHIELVEPLLQEAHDTMRGVMLGQGGELELDLGGMAEELEKRAALAALLVSTRSFPPSLVLPAPEELIPSAKEIVSQAYPKYRNAFEGRLSMALEVAERGRTEAQAQARQSLLAAFQRGAAPRVNGLPQVAELYHKFAAGGG